MSGTCCLVVNKFGSENRPDERRIDVDGIVRASGPTKAVVAFNVALGGNFVGKRPLKVSSRTDLVNLLTRIGADVQLEANTLIAAEILWSPEDSNESLTQEEIYSKYPELISL
jgi:uncharacterized membrane protein